MAKAKAKVGELTESLEDYLEIIYELVQERKVARVRDIARHKGVKMSSVVGALQRLSEAGQIHYQAREYVELTRKGKALAEAVTARHEFFTRTFRDLLGVEQKQAEQEACAVEHVVSVETMRRLRRLVEYVEQCPELLERVRQVNPPGKELKVKTPLPGCP